MRSGSDVTTGDLPHPLVARVWDRISHNCERKGAAEHREELLAGLSGRVMEIGAGNGINFGHYPATVGEVVAVEPEPYLRRLAEQAAKEAPVSVEVLPGRAEGLPGDDGAFDAAVASLVLCTVSDLRAALAEIARVLKPGGELRFYEHVLSDRPRFAGLQRAFDVVYVRLNGWGCHASRDTAAAIEDAGFVVEELRRFRFQPSLFEVMVSPHVIGRARKPADFREEA
jgi:SAM-dependent methyltransferase